MGNAGIICTVEKESVGGGWMNESLDTSPWINRNHTLEMKQSRDSRKGQQNKYPIHQRDTQVVPLPKFSKVAFIAVGDQDELWVGFTGQDSTSP